MNHNDAVHPVHARARPRGRADDDRADLRHQRRSVAGAGAAGGGAGPLDRALAMARGRRAARQRDPIRSCCWAARPLIGACLGLGVLILIHGMTLAGELVGQASGLTLRRRVRSGARRKRPAVLAADVPGGGERVPVYGRTPHGDGRAAGHVSGDSARQRRHSRLAGRWVYDAGEPELFAGHPRRRSRRDGAVVGHPDPRA